MLVVVRGDHASVSTANQDREEPIAGPAGQATHHLVQEYTKWIGFAKSVRNPIAELGVPLAGFTGPGNRRCWQDR